MSRNCENRCYNVSKAKGRIGGGYVEEGKPRGDDGNHVRTDNLILYEPYLLSPEEVDDVYGLNPAGVRTPYEDLHPAVRQVPVTVVRVYDSHGVPVGKSIIKHSIDTPGK